MIKTKREKIGNRHLTMRGLLNFEFPFRVSIYCNSNRSTHPRVILYYNERIFREFVLSKEKKIGGGKFTWNRNSNFWEKSKASFLIRDSTPIMPIESRFPWLNNRKFLIRRKHASRAFNV